MYYCKLVKDFQNLKLDVVIFNQYSYNLKNIQNCINHS